MHYYKRNIGDYYKKAGRLTMLQHGAYTQLIDSCYDRETFPTLDEALEWTWASTEDEIQAVKFVLKRFFTLDGDRYMQYRILEEIERYKKNGEINRRIAIEREAKRKEERTNRGVDNTNREESVDGASTNKHEAPPNQEPRTKNQEPIVKDTSTPRADRIDYKAVQEIFNSTLTKASQVVKMTDKRKRLVKRLFVDFDMNLEKFEAYLRFMNSSEKCAWMFETRDRGNGQVWQPKSFEYFVSEDCYLKAKEQY